MDYRKIIRKLQQNQKTLIDQLNQIEDIRAELKKIHINMQLDNGVPSVTSNEITITSKLQAKPLEDVLKMVHSMTVNPSIVEYSKAVDFILDTTPTQ